MADSSRVSLETGYESELTAGRVEVAEELNGVVDGILTGAIRLGSGADAVTVGVPDDLTLEIEFADEADGLSLDSNWNGPLRTTIPPLHRSRIGLVGAPSRPPW